MATSSDKISKNPPFYHRDYSKDFSKKEPLSKRVCLVALPFLSLYLPIGQTLSVVLGSSRAITSFNQANKNFNKKEFLLSGKNLFICSLAILSVANTFFKHQVGLLITNASDVFQNLLICMSFLAHGQLTEAMTSLVSVINSTAYMGMILCPSIEVILLALSCQIVFELVNSVNEFKKDRYLEGFAKLAMSSIRGYQAAPYFYATMQIHSKSISNFLTKQGENLASIFPRASAALASPFWWYSEKAVRIFSPIRTDQKDQELDQLV